MVARISAIVTFALMSSYGIAFGASAPRVAEPAGRCAEPTDRDAPPACMCIPPGGLRCAVIVPESGDAGKSGPDAKVARETESVLKIAEGTLEGVREHTDFLATLWKWSTIAAGIAAFVIAGFGIKTVRDLAKVRDEALEGVEQNRRSVSDIQERFDKLSREITSNFVVLMRVSSMQPKMDEVEAQRARLGAAAAADATFKDLESKTYGSMVKELSSVLQEHPPTDPYVASFAYDILGFAQYRTGNVSTALELARKSIGFRDNNPTALYNAASYAASIRLFDLSLGFLERAIEQNQECAWTAKGDEDFAPLRGLPRFMTLVGS